MLLSKLALKQQKEAAALAVDGEVTGMEVDPIRWGDGSPARVAAKLLVRALTVSPRPCARCGPALR